MLDPALAAVAPTSMDLSAQGIPAVRASLAQRRRAAAQAIDPVGVRVSAAAAGRVPVRIYRGGTGTADPAVVYCHAGAFVLGDLDTDHLQCLELARRTGCSVISVDYRLAPEHRHPAALHDALAVLGWVADNARKLDIDPGRLAVAGSSAGAALAAALAAHAADGQAPPVVMQVLHQPVLDDRVTASKQHFAAAPGFDGVAAAQMWRHYLGDTAPTAAAVPARRADLTGLAPAFISCSQVDPLRDEALDYARRLLDAGVDTELHLFAGTCHGFDSLLPDWVISQRLFEMQAAALRRGFSGRRT